MGFPQITDRMKSAPTQALRSVFAGIGRILLAADRPPEHPNQTAKAATRDRNRQQPLAPQRSASPTGLAASRWRSLDETGNVRLLSADDMEDEYGPQSRPSRYERSEPASAAGRPAPTELPLAAYDTLSLASIRARLRSLGPDQLRVLADYERSHAGRADVLGMLERRIEKLETGG